MEAGQLGLQQDSIWDDGSEGYSFTCYTTAKSPYIPIGYHLKRTNYQKEKNQSPLELLYLKLTTIILIYLFLVQSKPYHLNNFVG